ncbi:hypothetical protein L0Z19_09225 [Burkholderia multivorans]|uniref:hypothetical protein n=1 Tax=Burkholderia multivorans TaxID=87883 RepID=UPI002018B6F2|nr:hypothetical protein [Burkholderia multivorans]MCL4651600.1 hypothetical protein [Burkholderia multivorans]MCL4655177.1 hypothetical protein [Burkholderia multivorans]MCO1426105.1 hypothetical protein [Burkholderia multivorans]UQN51233.1 hypothetical protein L0Y88_09210 [Burkholderia multivorans]UQN84417.1 hypothetical protein L0Z18_19390 [Burkholderia multivorans]
MTTDTNTTAPRFTVTLAALRKAGACYDGYNKLVRSLQGQPFTEEDENRNSYIHFKHDAEIPLVDVLNSNGIDDALWSLRCVSDADRDIRLFAVWCARQVEHLMQDQRSKDALDVAERFANGEATEEERAAARAAAQAARDAARAAAQAARDAARDAAWAARAAAWAAGDAARDAAWDAAWDAARDAAWAAAQAARDAARAATWDAAWDAARDAQAEMFKHMCLGTAPWQQVKVAA